jgi:uncharacterized protein (DUF934 family)
MTVIVQDGGFREDDWQHGFAPPGDAGAGQGVEIASTDEALLADLLGAPAVRIRFGSFADGRGFSLARRLRRMGYAGRLRAAGHVLADQYAMARRSGFDEVEIDAALAGRQPEAHWRARANWREHDYRSRP